MKFTKSPNPSDKRVSVDAQPSQNTNTSLRFFLTLSLFLGFKKGVLDYFKVCSLSNNPVLGNIYIPFGFLILLACIRTVPSTLLKLKRILEKEKQANGELLKKEGSSKKEKINKKDPSSPQNNKDKVTQTLVLTYLFIAIAINFTAAHETFKGGSIIIYVIMLVYASAASTYEGLKFAKPLIERLSNCIMDAVSGDLTAKKQLHQMFWQNNRKYKFLIISLGAITTSFFLIYSIQSALGVITSLLFSRWNINTIFTPVSLYFAIFLTALHIIPYYAVTFREEADQAFAKKQDKKEGRITPTLRQLFEKTKVEGPFLHVLSLLVFGVFMAISIAFWFACAGVISIGAYIGAQSFFGNIWVSGIIFVIDFFHVLFYYDTEVSRIMLHGLMQLPVINRLFSTSYVQKQPQAVYATDQSEARELPSVLYKLHAPTGS